LQGQQTPTHSQTLDFGPVGAQSLQPCPHEPQLFSADVVQWLSTRRPRAGGTQSGPSISMWGEGGQLQKARQSHSASPTMIAVTSVIVIMLSAVLSRSLCPLIHTVRMAPSSSPREATKACQQGKGASQRHTVPLKREDGPEPTVASLGSAHPTLRANKYPRYFTGHTLGDYGCLSEVGMSLAIPQVAWPCIHQVCQSPQSKSCPRASGVPLRSLPLQSPDGTI
jgi:hypothetical protein